MASSEKSFFIYKQNPPPALIPPLLPVPPSLPTPHRGGPAHARSTHRLVAEASAALAEAAGAAAGGEGRARVGLCLLCGLPAAGKTSLARGLCRRLPRRAGWTCARLAYDQLIPAEACAPRPAGPLPLLPSWKRSRRDLLRCLESVLRALLTGEPPAAPAAVARAAWERVLACCRGQGLLGAATGPLCLLLDDNFYYRSMRYEVYQLARKYSLSFCQVFLECPLECCLQRNRLRSHPVPDQTIQLMATKIEVPDAKKNPWERNSLILKSLGCTPEDDEQIVRLLATALENPVKQNEEDTEQKEADRAICAASAVHQADQTCRRLISQAMRDARDKNLLPSEMKSLAEELNKLKAEFLEDLRQGDTWTRQTNTQNQDSDPATTEISSFQREAANVVNKYIFK
ncbi:L-seryl-tRNA(Sec) kinase [Apus apus]|uniref:L-seryl-tRNA(Sec) kinase n=1 Tax=Apus apus TaxID=8895 RepID=UPI0021F892C8|nr:L-seryl-tRNA(Sec) kinase [Apus apus]